MKNWTTFNAPCARMSGTGALSAGDGFDQGSWVRWRKFVYDRHNNLTAEKLYHDIPASGDGSKGSDYEEIEYVMEQTELDYDEAGNVVEQRRRDRFHDETSAGELNDPSTSPKARVYYVATYPDALGRTQAVADYGTNGGSSLTRPDTVPSSSSSVHVSQNTFDFSESGGILKRRTPKARTCAGNSTPARETVVAHLYAGLTFREIAEIREIRRRPGYSGCGSSGIFVSPLISSQVSSRSSIKPSAAR